MKVFFFFIHSFNIYLGLSFYVPGSVLSNRGIR
jgi:hypothetical protein